MLQKAGPREANKLNGKEELAELTSQGSVYILTVKSNHGLNSLLCLLLALMPIGYAFLKWDPLSQYFHMRAARVNCDGHPLCIHPGHRDLLLLEISLPTQLLLATLCPLGCGHLNQSGHQTQVPCLF